MPFPGRPEHPDFWALSSAVLKMDGRLSEEGQDLSTAIADIIDPESALYMADQRVRLMLRNLGYAAGPELVSMLSATWLDGLLAGRLSS
jgi:hypothetical protein